MRKFLIILLSILFLLVSCATKEVKQDEPEIEVIEATVVETPAPVVPEPSSEPVVPHEEPAPEPVPEPEPEPEPVVVEPVTEQEIIEPVRTEEIVVVEQPSEEDWSMVITASAPVEENPQEEEPEVKETTVEEPKPAEEKAPAVAETPAKTTETAKTAKEPSFVDKVTDILKKIGQYIVKEKLLSIGFLTCIIGVIYLIVALVKTRRPRDRFDSYYGYQDNNYEDQEPEVETPKPGQKKQDLEPEDEDDEFLRSLLGDNRD